MLPRIIGPSNSLDLFWSSRQLLGDEAYRIGFANRLCAEGNCLTEAQDYLREIASTSAPVSIMMMKKQVYRHLMQELGDAMDESTRWMDESLARDDFKEGVQSFVQKRPPNFARIDID